MHISSVCSGTEIVFPRSGRREGGFEKYLCGSLELHSPSYGRGRRGAALTCSLQGILFPRWILRTVGGCSVSLWPLM